ncbi:hypothetical protein ACFY3G_18255 [Streptomyces phaeochromogenes]|uniref:hypothetical protein n=1 Tax=Streptomyces phaeochromogenes TaxID=1923 RepID=UPI0036855DAC
MSRAMHDLVNRVAYLKRGVDSLLKELDAVDGLDGGALSPLADSQVEDANQRWAEGAADHIELATQYAEDWCKAVQRIIDDQWRAEEKR